MTNLSLPEDKTCPNTAAEGTIECKFWGLGGDGTVGANKNSIKIIGDHTDKYVQAYFQYDSKKTGGVTISHLRFGDKPIKSPYYINKADFVACHNPAYITKGFKMVHDVKPGGVFMINCQWDFEELDHHLNADAKRYIAKNNIQLYTINAIDLAIKIGMGKRTNTILQSAFFSLAKVMPESEAIQYMKDAADALLPEEGPGRRRYEPQGHRRRRHRLHEDRRSRRLGERCGRRPRPSLEGKPAARQAGQEHPRSRGQDGRRQPARFRLHAITWTASSSWALPLMRSAALPSPFPRGTRPSASSATTAPMSARTPPSVPSLSPRRRPRTLPPLPRS